MICQKCGYDVPDGMHFCGACGAELFAEQENQQSFYAGQQPTPGFNQGGFNQTVQQNAPVNADTPDKLLNAMSFFYPIFGFILYFIDREKSPVRAKSALKWAIVASVLYAIFFVLYFVGVFGMAFFAGAAETMLYF